MTTKVIKIDPENIDLEKIREAAEVIRKGGIVAFPTETVYGLAADFCNKQAVEKIFTLKKRPRDKPLTVQIQDIAYLEELASEIPTFAYRLMNKYWPGSLTLVLPARSVTNVNRIKLGVCNGARLKYSQAGPTIGVRIPSNKIAQSLLKMSGTALVAPSANLSGEPAAKSAGQVLSTFNGLIEAVIDGGEVELGVPSTVVDLSVSPFKILREGAIARKDIQSVQA